MTPDLTQATMDGPRFDLRFERGRVRLRLGQPLGLDGVELQHLVVALDFRGAVDLRGGAKRFRHVRSRVVELRARVRPDRVLAQVARGARVDEVRPGRLRLAHRDEAGVLAVDGALAFDGVDLVWQPHEVAWVRGSPRGTWERWERLAVLLGARVEPSSGAMRIERPLRSLLAELLLPHGWRVPDERGCGVRAVEEGGVLVVEAAERIVGPRLPHAPTLDFDAVDPSGPAGALRGCLDAADLAGAREAYSQLGGLLAGEAALAIAERFEHALEPDELAEWLVNGLSAFPEDERAWRRWVGRLAERGASGALRLADVALAGPLSRASRAELAVSAVMGILDMSFDLTSHGDIPSDPATEQRLRRVVTEAAALAPRSGAVLATQAALAHREGQLAEAARLWERAADAASADDRRHASEWRRRAGQLVLGLEGPGAALPLLERALEEADDAPEVLCELAAVQVERGERLAAEELFARLLRQSGRGAERRAALLAAARYHLEQGAPDRARPFLAELDDDSVSLAPWAAEPPGPASRSVERVADACDERSAVLSPASETSQVLAPWAERRAGHDESSEHDALVDDSFVDSAGDPGTDEACEEASGGELGELFEGTALRPSTGASEDVLERLVLRPREGDMGHLDSWLPRVGARPPSELPPRPPRGSSAPPVTLVSVADDELRALLEAVAESDEPRALLEGALEEALADADADGVRRVLRVLQRVDDFAGATALAARARRLLERLDEDP